MFLSRMGINARLLTAFGIVVAILTVLITTAKVSQGRQVAAQEINLHTYEVMQEASSMLSALINIETGARGYMLTGTETFLEPYNAGRDSFQSHWNTIKDLTSDNPSQQRRLDEAHERVRRLL